MSPSAIAKTTVSVFRNIAVRTLPPVVLKEPFHDVRAWDPNNLAHMICEIVPYAQLASRAIGGDVIAVSRRCTRHYLALANLLGIRLVPTHRSVRGLHVGVSGLRGRAAFTPHEDKHTIGLSMLPDTYADLQTSKSPVGASVFIARRSLRKLCNHRQVSQFLESRGYQTIFAEDFSLQQQLSIGRHASRVVAVHGAGLALASLARHLDLVVEIMPANWYTQLFPLVLAPRCRRYIQIATGFDMRTQHLGWDYIRSQRDQDVELSIALLDAALGVGE